MRLTTVIALALAVTTCFPTLAAAARTYDIDLAIRRGDSPEVVRGPVKLKLKNVNKVRYEVSIGQKVTLSDGPDLAPASFIPKLSTSVPKAGTPVAAGVLPGDPQSAEAAYRSVAAASPACPPTSGDLESRFKALHGCLTLVAKEVETALSEAQAASDALNARTASVENLVAVSDQVLLSSGATTLANRVTSEVTKIGNDLTTAATDWPGEQELGELRDKLEALEQSRRDLPFAAATKQEWVDWSNDNRERYEQLGREISAVGKALSSIEKGSDVRKAYEKATSDLRSWKSLLTGLGQAAAYSMELPVHCGYPFFQKKTVDYTLTLVDRTIADKSKNKTVEKIASVVCPSNVTVTGGIGASKIDEKDFGFVQSLPDPPAPDAPMDGMGEDAPALVTRIGLDNESEEQVNPAVLISTRLLTFDRQGAYSMHLTAGSVFDFDNPDSTVAIGYVLGLSVSFKDSTFVTLGIQGSRVPELAGGFELGDVQPMGLDKVPVTKDWDFAGFLGVTYRLGGPG
jgi:hypothetical protein